MSLSIESYLSPLNYAIQSSIDIVILGIILGIANLYWWAWINSLQIVVVALFYFFLWSYPTSFPKVFFCLAYTKISSMFLCAIFYKTGKLFTHFLIAMMSLIAYSAFLPHTFCLATSTCYRLIIVSRWVITFWKTGFGGTKPLIFLNYYSAFPILLIFSFTPSKFLSSTLLTTSAPRLLISFRTNSLSSVKEWWDWTVFVFLTSLRASEIFLNWSDLKYC